MTRKIYDNSPGCTLKLGLGARFVFLVIIILTITLGLSTLLSIRDQNRFFIEALREKGNMLGNFVALISPEAILSYDYTTLNDLMVEATHRQDIVYCLIVGINGHALTSYLNQDDGLVNHVLLQQKKPDPLAVIKQLQAQPQLVAMQFPIIFENERLGQVLVGMSSERMEHSVHQTLLKEVGFNALIILFLSVTIYGVFRYNALRAIQRLGEGATRVAAGDLLQPVEQFNNDELGHLTFSFNQMMAELERKQRELLLSKSELQKQFDFQQTLIDAVNVPIYYKDKYGAYLGCNSEFERVMGVSRHEILGKQAMQIPALASNEKYQDVQEQVLSENTSLMQEGVLSYHDEALHTVLMHMAPFRDEQGQVVGLIGANLDISARKKAEEELAHHLNQLEDLIQERTASLKKANYEIETKNLEIEDAYHQLKVKQSTILQQEKMASIGQLAAGVAHEINTPIGFVSSNLRTLSRYQQKLVDYLKLQTEFLGEQADQEQLQPLLAARKKLKLDAILEDAQDLIDESLEGTARVSKIVLQLKTFARVDVSGEQSTDINACLETTLSMVRNQIKDQVTIVQEFAELPPLVCLPQKLNQVFMNLLLNADQAIDQDGKIHLKTWQEDGQICIAIQDNGEGMTPETRKRIFEPFFTTREVGQGTGLGLSIAYDIVKQHGGEIDVVSALGEGSTFTLSLPLCADSPT